MRREFRIAVVIISFAAGAAVAQPRDCTLPSLSIPIRAPFRDAPSLLVSAGGGPQRRLEVDTGSIGIVIPRRTIGCWTAASDLKLSPHIYYSSSGRAMCGEWVYTSIAITDGPTTPIVLDKFPVLAVDYECLNAENAKDPCKCTSRETNINVAMMGVGFGRGSEMGTSQTNAFLNLPQMVKGTMQRGYIITTDQIILGMTADDVAGFRFVDLQRGSSDWQQAAACVSITGGGIVDPGQQICGQALVDTGVDIMYLTYPGTTFPFFRPILGENTNLWQCTKDGCPVNGSQPATVTVTWPGSGTPPFTYTVTSPRTFASYGTVPTAAHMHVSTTEGSPDVVVNTSRQLFYTADYLYDATCGRVGFRPKQTGNARRPR